MSTTEHVMSKFLNNPDDIVPESLAGLAAAHPDLVTVDLENQVVLRAGGPVKGKVALVSGGGSGHEPLHGGFVGLGMLDAACAGEVFTSPVPDQMLAAQQGRRRRRGRAPHRQELHRRRAELPDGGGHAGRRRRQRGDRPGRTTTWPWKTACTRPGAAARVRRCWSRRSPARRPSRAASLRDVAAVAQRVNDRSRSFGVALSSCTPPSAGRRFPDQPRRDRARRRHPRRAGTAPGAAGQRGGGGGADRDADSRRPGAGVGLARAGLRQRPGRHAGDRALRAVRRAVEAARRAGHRDAPQPRRPYITSLEMAGASFTLLELDSELEALWDAPVHTPALRWGV